MRFDAYFYYESGHAAAAEGKSPGGISDSCPAVSRRLHTWFSRRAGGPVPTRGRRKQVASTYSQVGAIDFLMQDGPAPSLHRR
jgi:hypothetical protein